MSKSIELLKTYMSYPETRFMGSKRKLLPNLLNVLKPLEFTSVIDAFAGSGCVSYMFKTLGKEVYSNDILRFSYTNMKSMVENNNVKLSDRQVKSLLKPNKTSNFIQNTFKDLYFSDEDTELIESIYLNIQEIEDEFVKNLAMSALIRACTKKRPRGIFTYIGHRYDDGRRDLRLSIKEHFISAVNDINNAVFDNYKTNKAFNENIFDLDITADLVYMDPPYLTSKSDNDYTRRYHFIEGLARGWKDVEIQEHTKTKKFKKLSNSFSNKSTVENEFNNLFRKFQKSIIILSYSSNSIPSKEKLVEMMKEYWRKVDLIEVKHTYSFGNQGHKIGNDSNHVQEYLFIGKN